MEDLINYKVSGEATSPGLAMGPAFVHRDVPDNLSYSSRQITSSEVSKELGRLDRALQGVLSDLKLSAERIEVRSGPKLAAIFSTHEAILEDASLREEIRLKISSELLNAAHALARVFGRWQEKFRSMPQQMLRERADDLADIEGRLLREMAGVKSTSLEKIPAHRILVAHRLLPSETVALPGRSVLGIVLEFGGPGSHAALLARALGIPTVAQIPDATELIHDGQEVIVDGLQGEVILSPNADLRKAYQSRRILVQSEATQARRFASHPARTSQGIEVAVQANVGGQNDVAAAVANGADGVSLYRMEQFYLARTTPPSSQELLSHLEETFAPMPGKPLTVRLLDLGADKPVPFLNFPEEDDPFLGRRGVRLLLRYPDLLTPQLEALAIFSRSHDLRILVPMVTLPSEMAEIRRLLEAAAAKAKLGRVPPLGAMIETPAAALTTGEIAANSDFLSIGTNDLTQYTMAAGRENPLVNEYFVEDHPAVLRLIGITAGEARGKPVGVCGELAAQLTAVPTLLQLGIRALGVAPPMIPAVKEAVRHAA